MDHLLISVSVQCAIVFSGLFLWVGMLTGVWKYWQIRHSIQARAHYYVDIAHRSSLLYAPASLILAVLAYFSQFPEWVNLLCVWVNLVFFSFSILSYILHGVLQDTTNQFKTPHRLGSKWTVPTWCMSLAMLLLVIGELGATLLLILGTLMRFLS
ncbi:hypothetical protein HYG93_13560 [Acinetobacter sp. SwsAc6]|jgi:uncharacterized membrane protein YhdT|uniref:hypothetical protein n=1 Tax=Acinetobacter TaxID=469 RepID=UPI000D132E42|nr:MULTISPECIES: hypothetical protein [Acinetobacter]NWK75271.1 hypothetical protein [Acinetobacter sp. SwsAc6]QCO22035.1 hypothetical protein C9E88_011350 [Acinetobacter cumulans]RFS34601.1 hypothetical protein DYI81_03630 [Acinetobacter sp. SWAC5]